MPDRQESRSPGGFADAPIPSGFRFLGPVPYTLWPAVGAEGVEFPFGDPLRYVTDFAATIPNASPSMRLDHLARRASEVDVINGQVVTRSDAVGLQAPYNETLCAVLRQREANFAGD